MACPALIWNLWTPQGRKAVEERAAESPGYQVGSPTWRVCACIAAASHTDCGSARVNVDVPAVMVGNELLATAEVGRHSAMHNG